MKTIFVDIDGVLNSYPQCWIDFVNSKTGSEFHSLEEMKNALVYSVYSNLKHMYRSSGYKRHLPIRENVVEKLRILHGRVNIVIFTSRPVDLYPNLLADTVGWLNDNNIPYDQLLFKKREIPYWIEKYQPFLVVEDDPEYIELYSKLCKTVTPEQFIEMVIDGI